MKKAIIILATLFSMSVVFAQKNFSTICIFNKAEPGQVYLNDKLVGGVNQGEILEFKILSRGHIAIKIVFSYERAQSFLNIADNKTYYMVAKHDKSAYGAVTMLESVDNIKWAKLSAKAKNTVTIEESAKNPIGEISQE